MYILRVDVRKNQSHKEGGAEQGSVDLADFHIYSTVFTLIIMVWFVFHKNDRMQDYGSLKFWLTRPQKNIHKFLISEPNFMIIFYFVDLEQENKVKINLRVNVRIIQSGAEQGFLDLADFHISCSVFHADSRDAIRFS